MKLIDYIKMRDALPELKEEIDALALAIARLKPTNFEHQQRALERAHKRTQNLYDAYLRMLGNFDLNQALQADK